MAEQRLEQLLLRPKPHPEEAGGEFLLDVGPETAPRDEEPLLSAELADRAEKLVDCRPVDGNERVGCFIRENLPGSRVSANVEG